jgi:hypothetical protein
MSGRHDGPVTRDRQLFDQGTTGSAPATDAGTITSGRWRDRLSGADLACVGAVLVGAVLCTIAAIQQPYSYDELTQITPYGTGDPGKIVSATRQPPLAPLAEALVQQVFGEGHLQQRLLPLLSGIGCLVLMALLLRRYGLRYAAAGAVLVMATEPLLVRYSAYTRPYTEPMVLMLLLAWAAQAWLDDGRRRWLVTVAVAAFALPLVRVPEPMTFLGVSLLVFLVLGWRREQPWRRVGPLALVLGAAILTVGLWQLLALRSSSSSFTDTSAEGLFAKAGRGVHELVTAFVPLLGNAFPWWPVTLAVVVAAIAVPLSRRRLFSWPAFWPLLAGPVAFALAYHFASRISFDALPYRSRFATFFVLPLILVVAALLSWIEDRWSPVEEPRPGAGGGPVHHPRRALRFVGVGLVALMVVTQLPRTFAVVTRDSSPDFDAISAVIHAKVPDDAIVLYDRPTPAGASRQHFVGKSRFLGEAPTLFNVKGVAQRADELPANGPVFLLFNGQCAYSGRCIPGLHHLVDYEIPGWHVIYTHDRFSLYAPDGDGPAYAGPRGVIRAMEGTGRAMGTEIGYLETYTAAAVLRSVGREQEADPLVARLEKRIDPALAERIAATDNLYHFLAPARGTEG